MAETERAELLAVTQADREAAADLIETYWSGSDANMLKLARSYRDGHTQGVWALAFAAHRLAALSAAPRNKDALLEAVKPWSDYHGDLPDFDDPMRCVFESGVQYTVDLLAKELGVETWEVCDGTEEFDGDLGGTLINIVKAVCPLDEHGDHLHPSELAALSPPAIAPEGFVVVPRVPTEAMLCFGVEAMWPGDEAVYPDEHDGCEAAIRATYAAMLAAAETAEAPPVSYAEYQQRRGMLPDIIESAIAEYDEWMKDDHYDARVPLDKIIERLKSARDIYDSPALAGAETAPPVSDEALREAPHG